MSFPTPLTVRFVVGSIDVTLPAYQWGYRGGKIFYMREFGSNETHLFREPVGVSSYLGVRFLRQAAVLEQLRDVIVEGMRSSLPLTFYPDASSGLSLVVDPIPTANFRRVVDGVDQIEIVFLQRP